MVEARSLGQSDSPSSASPTWRGFCFEGEMTSRHDTRGSRYGWSDDDWERMVDPVAYRERQSIEAMNRLASALERYCDAQADVSTPPQPEPSPRPSSSPAPPVNSNRAIQI